MLLDNPQVIDTDQGGHRFVPAGDDETLTAVGTSGKKFGKVAFHLGNGDCGHNGPPKIKFSKSHIGHYDL